MKTSHQHVDSASDEQAALWAARLDGDHLDAKQRAELDAWLADKPGHRALLTHYCQFSADLEASVPALVAAGAVTMPEVTRPAPRGRRVFLRLSGVALACAAAVAVTVSVLRPKTQIESIATPSAKRELRTLADGTRVELNANTSLQFENGATERRVNFAGGEALFVVAKDATRPFFVDTPTGSVRVTGTTFNVISEPSAAGFEVTVVEGRVEVRAHDPAGTGPATPIPLAAGQQFSAHGGAGITQTLSQSLLDDALGWRSGKIIFYNTPLAEALARYARYHGRTIQVAPAVSAESVGGRYSVADLSGFLHGIEKTLPVTVSYDANYTVVVGPRP